LSLPLIIFGAVCWIIALSPLTVYLACLAKLNYRSRPTVVTGGSDFLGLMAGLSGFILAGAVIFMTLVQANTRYLLRGDWSSLRDLWQQEQLSWITAAAAYFLLVSGAIGLAWLGRSGTLAIYNIRLEQLEALIDKGLTELGFTALRLGRSWSEGSELLQLDYSPLFCHGTIRSRFADPRLWEEFVRGLRDRIQRVEAPHNSAAIWFLTACFFILMILGFCLFIVGYFVYLSY
jgi:hypothetical protein